MKIAIEAQRIFRKNKHGMDFVALESIRCLQKIDKTNEYFILVSPGEDHCLEETPNMHIVEVKCPSYPLWEQVALPLVLKKIKIDVLHCTSNTAPIFGSTPLIVTLHDIIFLEKQTQSNPSLYQKMGRIYRRLVVPKILKKCSKIITVSHFEKERIKEGLKGIVSEKTELLAVYNGYGKHFFHRDDFENVVKKYISAPRYIFFFGNTDPKKNTVRTLRAYGHYARKSSDAAHLLIADIPENVLDGIIKTEGLEDVKNMIHPSGYIYNADMPYIYSGAQAFLYTSLRESFGIPILEAMACGVPVVTSSTSAIPEVAGKDALLVDPTDENEIAEALLRLENDEEYKNSVIQYGLCRVKDFSWENTAKALLDIYESMKK
ncbi:MAG: glycosyltransferase family 1 protein [Flavobacteriales bacterium]|nr:glycosyltransferase family 1 protein [Flavobacteriales bacterium]